MSQSRLIELSYYDPKTEVRLTAYADTLVLDEGSRQNTMTAIRFGGYPEMVNAMAAAILNTPGRMVQADRAGGACVPLKWCTAAAAMVH